MLASLGLWHAGPALADGLLWQVRDRDGAVCGHLFGTLHLCDRGCFPLPQSVLSAFDEAGMLVLELDPQAPGLGEALSAAGRLPPGQRLDRLLPAGDADRLAQALEVVGIDPSPMQGMRPWLAGTVLAVAAASRAGFDARFGVEPWLAERARKRGIGLVPLETVERQIAALSGSGLAAQVESLRQTVDMIIDDEVRDYFERIRDAWRTGDADALLSLMNEGADPSLMAPMPEAVIHRRNREMADRIAGFGCGPSPYFAAVGGAHFGGEFSLVRELERAGRVVVQIP